MDKLKEKLSRLMYGRYGIDQLGNFMMWAAVAMMIFGAVVRSSLIYTLAFVLIVLCWLLSASGGFFRATSAGVMRKTRNSWN